MPILSVLVTHGIQKRSVALAIGKLPNLVPSLLQLPLKVQERVVVSPLVAELLDSKLADRPIVSNTHMPVLLSL